MSSKLAAIGIITQAIMAIGLATISGYKGLNVA